MRWQPASTAPRGRRRRLWGIALIVAALSALALPLDAFGFGATGNPAAIAFYRGAAAKTDALPAYALDQVGWVRAKDSVKKDQVSWAWGFAQFTSNDYPAKEHIVLVQHGGSTQWLEDIITPLDRGCHVAACKQYPIEIIVHRAEAYEGIVVSGSSARCFKREPLRKVPYTVGNPWWVAVGHFAPKVIRGALTQITSAYVNEGQHVTETDLIATKTRLFARSQMYAAATTGRRAFSYRLTDVQLARAPRAPSISICS